MLRSFFLREPDKKDELHHFGRARVDGGEPVQGFIEREQLLIGHRRWQLDRIEIHPFQFSAALARLLLPCPVHQDAPHRFCGRGEEMRAILPGGLLVAAEMQPCFMNEGGWLKRMTWRFARHFLRGERSQLLVNQRHQLLGGGSVALLGSGEDLGDIAHSTEPTAGKSNVEDEPRFRRGLRGADADNMLRAVVERDAIDNVPSAREAAGLRGRAEHVAEERQAGDFAVAVECIASANDQLQLTG